MIQRMDNVLIVVEDLEAAKAFFAELGMELEGETTVEGPWVDQTIGLNDVRADITMMRTPDGHGPRSGAPPLRDKEHSAGRVARHPRSAGSAPSPGADVVVFVGGRSKLNDLQRELFYFACICADRSTGG